MSDYFETRERLRQRYIAPKQVAKEAKGEQIGEAGFLTEVAGRVILTAPAGMLTAADQLPKELAERWEKASTGNPYMTWIQGRYVEAEKANRNGAYWSTDDLQFGEMSVKHGPLNWLHEERSVIGTIADNALIRPEAQKAQWDQHIQQMSGLGYIYNMPADTFTHSDGTVIDAGQLWVDTSAGRVYQSSTTSTMPLTNVTTTANTVLTQPMPRPYMAAVSAMWNWVHPDKVDAVEIAADAGKLWYSMECVGREMSCVSDETHTGCDQSFDYVTAMTQPDKVCEHMRDRTSARRIVDPAFLGGAVIVPPAAPGWGNANAEIIRNSASLAEQTYSAAADMSTTEWEQLIASVIRLASR